MSYAIYVLEVELSRIAKELRNYKSAIDNGEFLNHELDTKLYEKRISELKTVIKDLKSQCPVRPVLPLHGCAQCTKLIPEHEVVCSEECKDILEAEWVMENDPELP